MTKPPKKRPVPLRSPEVVALERLATALEKLALANSDMASALGKCIIFTPNDMKGFKK